MKSKILVTALAMIMLTWLALGLRGRDITPPNGLVARSSEHSSSSPRGGDNAQQATKGPHNNSVARPTGTISTQETPSNPQVSALPPHPEESGEYRRSPTGVIYESPLESGFRYELVGELGKYSQSDTAPLWVDGPAPVYARLPSGMRPGMLAYSKVGGDELWRSHLVWSEREDLLRGIRVRMEWGMIFAGGGALAPSTPTSSARSIWLFDLSLYVSERRILFCDQDNDPVRDVSVVASNSKAEWDTDVFLGVSDGKGWLSLWAPPGMLEIKATHSRFWPCSYSVGPGVNRYSLSAPSILRIPPPHLVRGTYTLGTKGGRKLVTHWVADGQARQALDFFNPGNQSLHAEITKPGTYMVWFAGGRTEAWPDSGPVIMSEPLYIDGAGRQYTALFPGR